MRTPPPLSPRTAIPIWASLFAAAIVLAACAGDRQNSNASAGSVFARGLDDIREFYIDPVSTRRVALAGMARLARIDNSLAISDSADPRLGDAFGLSYNTHNIAVYSMPADGNDRDWGELIGNLTTTARQTSPRLASLPQEAVEKLVFDGMTGALDHYSRYATPKTAKAQRAERDGYSGIGVTLESVGNVFRVASLCPHGPAEQAGIHADDELLAVDGVPTSGRPQDDVMEQLRGPVGTTVAVSIRPSAAGSAAPRELRLQRAFVTLPTVTMRRDGNIAVFRIASFNQSTTARMTEQLAEARQQAGGQLAGIVLDLRGDPGGLLDQAVSLADLFIPKGPIASTAGRHPASQQYFSATGRAVAPDLPIAVLVNGGSASASEIVAAALQDLGRAVVIGSSSYGKGTVQTVLHLPNDGELILTWARLMTPSGRLLQSHGVVPTVCTSDLGEDERSVEIGLQRASHPGTIRPSRNLDEQGWSRLRQSCPARHTRPAIDLKLAERLLADPQLYSQALQAAGKTASLGPAGQGAALALTEQPDTLSSEARRF